MAMTPEKLAEDLKRAYGERLVAVILYGSGATGERHPRWSDHNVLVVLDRVDAEALRRASGAVRRWVRAGNHPPVTMTPAFLASSADVFPLEWLDMREAHRVLAGRDVLEGLAVPAATVRGQVERELRTALLRLQGELAAAGGLWRARQVRAALIKANSTFQVLFRGLLRLAGPGVPAPKREAAAAAARAFGFDPAPFEWAERLRHGDAAARAANLDEMTGLFLSEAQRVIERVDAFTP